MTEMIKGMMMFEGNDDVQEVIHTTSAAGDSAKSILLLPERNEEDTGWLSHEGINPTSVFNKMKPEDLATVHKRKDMLVERPHNVDPGFE